jgi:DNA helicase HerA-like ATPase
VLIVIDEAHNLCTNEPADALQAAVTDRLVQIAAEGRKYGLWLLLSTQRPSKIHPNVLSQCDNLMMMRMNSPGDVAELGEVFGFAPPSLLAAAPTFGLGECLLAGRFSPLARIAKIGERLTFQGGADVDVPRSAD